MNVAAGRPSGKLAENIGHFARLLRAAGLPVGPGAVLDVVAAVEQVGLRRKEDLFWALHAVFVTRHEHSALFAEAFGMFFRRRAYAEKMIAALSRQAPPRPDQGKPVSRRVAEAFATQAPSAPLPQPEMEVDARYTVSDREVLQKKDFAQMSAAEISEAMRLVSTLVLPADLVAVRRARLDPRGSRIDARATLRQSLRSGGEFRPPARKSPREEHPPLVAVVDISGSMSTYTRLFLRFLHALMLSGRKVEVFLFGTRLTNVTRAMMRRNPDEALKRCSDSVEDWSGGTRIAASLRRFNKEWSRRVMSGGPVVMLVTDGLERELDAGLATEIDRLHRSCRRLVWLNPLLRFEGFEAKAAGIRAMLPHVDEFRSIHSLESMAELVSALGARASSAADPRRYLEVA